MEELYNDMITREEIREYLNAVYDLERLVTRISYRTANPRDLIAFKTSLGMIPPVKQLLSQAKSAELKEIDERMDCLEDIYDLIEKSIQDEPPIMIREGGMIRVIMKTWISSVSQEQKAKPGWRSWKLVRRRKPASRIFVCAITKFSVIIWKLPIPIRSWCRRTGPANRHWPMQSVILRRN